MYRYFIDQCHMVAIPILCITVISLCISLEISALTIVPRLSFFHSAKVLSSSRWTNQRRRGILLNMSLSLSNPARSSSSSSTMKFVDIGANLLDERFTKGEYHGKYRHEPDWDAMIERAQGVGVTKIILTAGTLKESQRALELVRELRQKYIQQQEDDDDQEGSASRPTTIQFGCTIGVHPTRCSQEFVQSKTLLSDEDVLIRLKELALDGQTDQSVVSIGEIGLDYDRLEFCDQETQLYYLERQLEIFSSNPQLDHLPLFLHNRNVGDDLLHILQKDPNRRCHGVVHSFDDTLELAEKFINLGLYIGINGCSLKTSENLQVIKALPLDKILLETDCPYCEIKGTHAGFKTIQTKWDKKVEKNFQFGKMVKGRNEPCQIIQVAEVIAHVKGISVQDVADACYDNTCKLYGWEK